MHSVRAKGAGRGIPPLKMKIPPKIGAKGGLARGAKPPLKIEIPPKIGTRGGQAWEKWAPPPPPPSREDPPLIWSVEGAAPSKKKS